MKFQGSLGPGGKLPGQLPHTTANFNYSHHGSTAAASSPQRISRGGGPTSGGMGGTSRVGPTSVGMGGTSRGGPTTAGMAGSPRSGPSSSGLSGIGVNNVLGEKKTYFLNEFLLQKINLSYTLKILNID